MKALSSHLAVCVYNPHGDSSGAKRSEWACGAREKGGERERETWSGENEVRRIRKGHGRSGPRSCCNLGFKASAGITAAH